MNILQVLPRLDVGGVETGTVDISKELIKKGHKVIVVSNGGRLVKELINSGVRHIKLPVDKKSVFTVIKMVKRLRYIIREERVDIIHARSRVPAIIAFFAARQTDACFITTAHGYYSTHFLSRVMSWGKYVVVASSVIGRHMIEDFGVPRERIRFIPRGVDLGKFRFKPIDPASGKTEYKIGVVGRITPIKGHAFFIQAIARVVRIFPRTKVFIVGDAPDSKPEYRDNLKALVKKLNIERFVEFLGSRYDMPEVMSELDLLVLPSIGQEAFGRVIIEAGASGVPVIATRIGGAVDIIEDGKTGLLVKPGDIMEMVDSIIKLLKDRPLARDMADEARKRIEKEYSLTRMTEDTAKLYEEAHSKKKILIVKIGALGDVILSVPSIKALRNSFPEAFISALVGVESRRVLKKCPYIDEVVLYDRKEKDRGLRGFLKISSILRRKAFDISIDLQNNRTSHLMTWMSSIPKRFGYSNRKMGFLINNKLKYLNIEAGPVEEQFRILKRAGVNTIGASKRLEIWPGKEDDYYIDNFLKDEWVSESHTMVGINIGGSWKTKRWPLKYFAKLSDMLAAKDIRVIVTGSKGETAPARELAQLARSKVINAAGKTNIMQLAALIKRCSVYVTGDSAPMHIASAMGTDFIALFGPTDPRRHLEPADKGRVVKKEVSCGPCYKASCKKNICMEKISVDEVYKLIVERINV